MEKARAGLKLGITEIHMVGGLHPTLKGEWYLELIRSLRALDAEFFHQGVHRGRDPAPRRSRLQKVRSARRWRLLREAGLCAITGGGAEIFDQTVRDQICRGKETAEEWWEVHRTWHEMGMRSTATMLYGHIETAAQRVDHLRRLRELAG